MRRFAAAKSLVMTARPPSWHRVRGGGGEVDSLQSVLAHMGLVQSLLVNGPHPTWQGFTDKLTRLSWQGLVGKSFTPIYGIAKESQRRHLRSMWL
jgi:hypothetical protein